MVLTKERLRQGLRWAAMLVLILVLIHVPWEDFRSTAFIDRENYLDAFLARPARFSYLSLDHWYSYITNEYLWHVGVSWLIDTAGFRVEGIFAFISFLCFLVATLIVTRGHAALLGLLLINPLLVDLAMSQYRLALALSILGIALLVDRKWLKLILLGVAPLIHTASVLFVLMYLFADHGGDLARRRLGVRFVFPVLMLAGVFFSLLIGPFREVLLGYFGDRRAEYPDMSSSISYLLFWVALLPIFAAQPARFYGDRGNRFAVLILSLVTSNLVTGAYSARFLASALPFLILAMRSTSPHLLRVSLISVFVFYSLLQWMYWLGLVR